MNNYNIIIHYDTFLYTSINKFLFYSNLMHAGVDTLKMFNAI